MTRDGLFQLGKQLNDSSSVVEVVFFTRVHIVAGRRFVTSACFVFLERRMLPCYNKQAKRNGPGDNWSFGERLGGKYEHHLSLD